MWSQMKWWTRLEENEWAYMRWGKPNNISYFPKRSLCDGSAAFSTNPVPLLSLHLPSLPMSAKFPKDISFFTVQHPTFLRTWETAPYWHVLYWMMRREIQRKSESLRARQRERMRTDLSDINSFVFIKTKWVWQTQMKDALALKIVQQQTFFDLLGRI